MQTGKSIVLFDGYCNFCSWSVLFIVKRDKQARFQFAASQSPEGKKILAEFHGSGLAQHSILLIEKDRVHARSDAALRIARRLRGGWPLFYGFIILPRGVRDFFYIRLARSRYRLFGMREHCFVPDESIRERFLPPVP